MSSKLTCDAAVEQGAGLGAEHQVLRGPQAGAPADPVVDEGRRIVRAAAARRRRAARRSAPRPRRSAPCARRSWKRSTSSPVKSGSIGCGSRRRGLADDGHLVVLRQVVDRHVEHEAVELGLGQRVGAFHLDGVLRGEDEERLVQRVAHAGGGHLVLLHRLEQGRLRLGRRAVDLVGQDHVGEDRALDERHPPLAGPVSWRISVPVMSAGIRSGVNWIRWNFRWKSCASDLTSSVLARPGAPVIRQCPPREHGDQQLLDHVLLADDDLGQLGADALALP